MENFVLHLAANPLLYIGYLLCLFAAAGVLYFVSGVVGGVKHMLAYDQAADHLKHHRVHALQGLYLCMVILGIWETIRIFLGETPGSTFILVIILLSPVWAPWLKALLSGRGGGH